MFLSKDTPMSINFAFLSILLIIKV